MRVLFSNGAEVSLYVRVLNSIILLGSHYAGFKEEDEEDDEDDPNRAPARTYMWAWSIKRVANVWQNCIEVNGKAGPVVSTVLALPMPPWKRCSKFLEH